MMQDQELVRFQRELRVRLSLIVRELDLIGTVEQLHDGANLPA